jgi:dephospho-CoA kinase
VKRVLVTGLSGTGKSAVVSALAARGHRAVDLDCDDYSCWVEADDVADAPGTPVEPARDWVWRGDRVRDLLSDERGDVLFVSGCAANMVEFLPRFDHVVLLSAPVGVIAARLRARTGGSYGALPEHVAREADLAETVEPLLRRVAGHEVDTTAAPDDVVATILRIAAG